MIYLTGDTHGKWEENENNVLGLKDRLEKIEDGSKVIILGDFGFIFHNTWTSHAELLFAETLKMQKLKEYCKNRNIEILFIDGNHENFDRLDNDFETVTKYGAKCREINENIYYITRGNVLEIEGKKFFCFGGGNSIDKMYRSRGLDWWEREIYNQEEKDFAKVCLDRHNWEVDYILTHCCANDIIKKMDKYSDKLYHNDFDGLFGAIEEGDYGFGKIDYTHWYFGHMHEDLQVDEKHTCVYDVLIEIK